MNELDKIRKLIRELQETVKQAYPQSTNARLSLGSNGYAALTVEQMKVDKGLPIEAWKRRELLDQYTLDGSEWSADRSAEQNDFYRQHKVLLGDC